MKRTTIYKIPKERELKHPLHDSPFLDSPPETHCFQPGRDAEYCAVCAKLRALHERTGFVSGNVGPLVLIGQ